MSHATPPTSPPRRPRPGAALGVAAAVLCLHAALMGVLAPALPQRLGEVMDDEPRPLAVRPAVQVRTLAAAPADPDTQERSDTSADNGSPTRQVVATGAVPQTPPARPLAARRPAVAPGPADPPPATGATRSSTEPVQADTQLEPGRPRPPPDPPGGPAAAPPPVYATRIPPPVRLRYTLRYNGQAGEATLSWRHDGLRYQLALDGHSASQALDGHSASQALVTQASLGGFDSAGLAPERFTDRRRGSSLQAANFRRDIGRIAFSGPAVDYPAWPGAQDRLSWLPQLVAIRAAAAAPSAAPAHANDAAPTPTSLFVVDARGAGALWHFQPDGEALLPIALGTVAVQRWRREPPHPEGLRVEAWLDATRGHWPVLLRFTALRSGDVFELLLQDEPDTPP